MLIWSPLLSVSNRASLQMIRPRLPWEGASSDRLKVRWPRRPATNLIARCAPSASNVSSCMHWAPSRQQNCAAPPQLSRRSSPSFGTNRNSPHLGDDRRSSRVTKPPITHDERSLPWQQISPSEVVGDGECCGAPVNSSMDLLLRPPTNLSLVSGFLEPPPGASCRRRSKLFTGSRSISWHPTARLYAQLPRFGS